MAKIAEINYMAPKNGIIKKKKDIIIEISNKNPVKI